MHNPGTIGESQEHVFVGMECWCRPTTTCPDCHRAGVPLQEARSHVFPLWAVHPEVERPAAAPQRPASKAVH